MKLSEEQNKALLRKMEESLQEQAYQVLTGYTEQPKADWGNSRLTMKEIEEAMEKLRKIEEEPFRKLLRDHGFDEDRDWIFIPDLPAYRFMKIPKSLEHRVKVAPASIATVLLMRNPLCL